MEKSSLGAVPLQELPAQSGFIEQQLLYYLHKYFNFSGKARRKLLFRVELIRTNLIKSP